MCGVVQDMTDQKGKVCVVTGGASGMGWHCAKASWCTLPSLSRCLLIAVCCSSLHKARHTGVQYSECNIEGDVVLYASMLQVDGCKWRDSRCIGYIVQAC